MRDFVPRDFEEAVRDFAAKSRRRLAQMLAHPGSRSQGILGARTFVSRPKTLPLHSGKAKRAKPLGSPHGPSSTDALLRSQRR